MTLSEITDRLVADLAGLRFGPPVACVYNPLIYARACWEEYLRRYGRPPREVLVMGMNPGPFGMAQTGVPFGEISMVRDWLGICAPVGRPAEEHPKRPIQGFDCARSEVSGARVWGWARDRFKTPEAFFRRFFVANYCPLVFIEEGGRNRTPDQLPKKEQAPLLEACDRALRATVELLRPRLAIGVGRFAEGALRRALAGLEVEIASVLHPSPANPQANRGWAARADARMQELGVLSQDTL
jgi:single-strand selective monofunctional uracil DNA glycosylase